MPESVTVDGKDLLALCATDEVSEDTPVRVESPAMDYAVFTLDGAYYVTQDLCTHGPGSLAEGFVEGTEIECPFHQGRFDFCTGAATMTPCSEALRIWTVQVVDGKVCIDPAENRIGG